MPGQVLAILEHRDGVFRKSAYEAASAAFKLAEELGASAAGLVIADQSPAEPEGFGAYGIDKVLVATHEVCNHYIPEAYLAACSAAIKQIEPQIVLFTASSTGKDLAPRVATSCHAGLATDCTEVAIVDGKLEVVRPVYAGKAFQTIAFNSGIQMASLRPNVFTPRESKPGSSASVEDIRFEAGKINTVFKEFKPTGGEKVELLEAPIVVSGGRGLKGPENFHLVEELAETLGAAVGASRAVVDAGWRPHAEQVGQTGKTVSPDLYIAVAISGAIQHLAGMSSSKVIVAINKDKDAPIFTKADYGIVGDAFEIVPRLIEELRNSTS